MKDALRSEREKIKEDLEERLTAKIRLHTKVIFRGMESVLKFTSQKENPDNLSETDLNGYSLFCYLRFKEDSTDIQDAIAGSTAEIKRTLPVVLCDWGDKRGKEILATEFVRHGCHYSKQVVTLNEPTVAELIDAIKRKYVQER